MGSTIKRLRGTRTHGGGSHKNRRSAGNRGVRDDGSQEKQNFQPTELGKDAIHPPKVRDIASVSLREITEHYFHEQVQTGEKVEEVDAYDLVDEKADAVKILGIGQLSEPLTIIADEFSETAVEAIESSGGSIVRNDKEADKKHIELSTSADEAGIPEEVISEEANKKVDSVYVQQELKRVYIELYNQLDVVVSWCEVRESTPRQRVIYSLTLAGVFIPVVDRPVGYITVTGVIYAILSDIAKCQR